MTWGRERPAAGDRDRLQCSYFYGAPNQLDDDTVRSCHKGIAKLLVYRGKTTLEKKGGFREKLATRVALQGPGGIARANQYMLFVLFVCLFVCLFCLGVMWFACMFVLF